MDQYQDAVRKIEQDFYQGRINVRQAVDSIDAAVEGITRVVCKPGYKFKICNHNKVLALQHTGLSRKEEGMRNLLAILLYGKAQENGSRLPGELHLGKGFSTKDYKAGIDNVLKSYLN